MGNGSKTKILTFTTKTYFAPTEKSIFQIRHGMFELKDIYNNQKNMAK